MKKIAILLSVVMLSGCGMFGPRKIQTVEVDRPVPSCPKPPEVPQCTYLVDQLTPADKQNPGKVGMAYKHDMTCLRTIVPLYNQVLDQYNQTNQDFAAVKANIDKANSTIKK